MLEVAREVHAVDLNEYALRQLSERFQSSILGSRLFIYKNDGANLVMIGDESISTVYCWDAAVHFDKLVIREYLRELFRVLKPKWGGIYSSLGSWRQG